MIATWGPLPPDVDARRRTVRLAILAVAVCVLALFGLLYGVA